EPAASESTMATTCRLEKSGLPTTIGWIRAAAVVSARVAEPWAMRTMAAMTNPATMTGSPRAASESASESPMPLARRTPPNMPPAPVMRMIEQTGPRAESTTFSTIARPFCCRQPSSHMAMTTVMSSAIGVSPSSRRDATGIDSGSTQPASPAKLRPVSAKMSTSGRTRRKTTWDSFGREANSANSSPLPPGEDIGDGDLDALSDEETEQVAGEVPGRDGDDEAADEHEPDVRTEQPGGGHRTRMRRHEDVHRGERHRRRHGVEEQRTAE